MRPWLRSAAALVAVAVFLLVALRPVTPRATAGNGDANTPTNPVDSGYAPDTNFQAFRSSIAVADTRTTTNVLALPALQVQGRTCLLLGARFSASGANAVVELAYVWRHPQATSDTDVTSRAFSWRNTTWLPPPAWANTTYTVASNKPKGWSSVLTLTAGTRLTEGTYYPAPDFYVDTERALTVRVVVDSVSSGTVDFWLGS